MFHLMQVWKAYYILFNIGHTHLWDNVEMIQAIWTEYFQGCKILLDLVGYNCLYITLFYLTVSYNFSELLVLNGDIGLILYIR